MATTSTALLPLAATHGQDADSATHAPAAEGLEVLVYHRSVGVIQVRALHTWPNAMHLEGGVLLPEDTALDIIATLPVDGRGIQCRMRGRVQRSAGDGMHLTLSEIDPRYRRFLAARPVPASRAGARPPTGGGLQRD
jgi:hypothetical protein